jgi:hypothetical protein
MLLRAVPQPPWVSMAATARPPTMGGRPLNEVLDAMTTGRRSVIKVLAAAALLSVAALLVLNWTWYQSEDRIKAHLLAETPVGTSEASVVSRLRANGVEPGEIWRGPVPPNTGYPPSTVPGHSFLHVVVGEYRIVFTTSIEAFYIFDAERRLAEITVRKTTDAL